MSAAEILIPVVSRYAKAWPRHGDNAAPADYLPAALAFRQAFADDAHFAAYSVPEKEHRLDSSAIGHVPIEMRLFVVDVEPEKHAPRTVEWDAQEQPKIERAIADGALHYWTRGGYRLVWTIEPFTIATTHDAEQWKESYLNALREVRERYGIEGDTTCKDWTRLYRLPMVVRDGAPQRTEVTGAMACREFRIVDAPAPTSTTVAPLASDAEPPSDALLAHVRDRLDRHGPARAHQKHGKDDHGGDEHTYQACAILVRDYGLDDATAWPLLKAWNETCVPPWSDDELATKLDNAFNYGKNEIGAERTTWELDERNGLHHWMEKHRAGTAPTTRNAPPTTSAEVRHELTEFAIEPSTTPAELPWSMELERAHVDVTSKLGTVTTTDVVPPPLFVPAVDLLRTKFTDDPWLIRGLIKRGGTAIIAGAPKCGKSWALTEAGLAINSGTKAFGTFETGAPLRVAYFYAEDFGVDVQAHVNALAAGRRMDPLVLARNLYVQPRGRFLDVLRDEDLALIVASIRKLGGVDVLCLEPLRDVHSGEEDKSDDMSAVMRRLRLLGEILGATILTAHHNKKAGDDMRGSSAIQGAYDALLSLTSAPGGNGEDIIAAHVKATVKGARSAGAFDWTLKLDDDPRGRSTRAVWTITRDTDKARETSDDRKSDEHEERARPADVAAVVAYVSKLAANGSAPMNVTNLRKSVPEVPEKRCRKAISVALANGYLRQGQASDPTTHTGRMLTGDRITLGPNPLPAAPGPIDLGGAS